MEPLALPITTVTIVERGKRKKNKSVVLLVYDRLTPAPIPAHSTPTDISNTRPSLPPFEARNF